MIQRSLSFRDTKGSAFFGALSFRSEFFCFVLFCCFVVLFCFRFFFPFCSVLFCFVFVFLFFFGGGGVWGGGEEFRDMKGSAFFRGSEV